MTARTSKPSISISAEDLDALASGRLTLQSIADREGCTKQNISKRIARMRAASTTETPTTTGSPIPTDSILIDPVEIATSAGLGLLHRAHAALVAPDQIGPSGLKALAATVTAATGELRQLGVLSDNGADVLTELTVRVLSDDEHAQIKSCVEMLNDNDEN